MRQHLFMPMCFATDGSMHPNIKNHLKTYFSRVYNFNDNDQSTQPCAPYIHGSCSSCRRFGHNLGTWQMVKHICIMWKQHISIFSLFEKMWRRGMAHSAEHAMNKNRSNYQKHEQWHGRCKRIDGAHCILRCFIWHQIDTTFSRSETVCFVWMIIWCIFLVSHLSQWWWPPPLTMFVCVFVFIFKHIAHANENTPYFVASILLVQLVPLIPCRAQIYICHWQHVHACIVHR